MLYDHDEMVDSLPSKSYLNNSKLDSFELLSNQSVYQDDQEISSIVDLKEKNIDQTLTLRNISLTNTTTEFDKLDKLVSNPNGFKILLLKLKEILQEAKELSAYFKKVATLEAEFATGLQKLQNPLMKDFVSKVGDLRSKFSKELTELSETVGVLVKDTERSRKQLKDALQKYSKEILDVDEKMTRAREKYEGSILEWEKFNEQGGNTMSKFGMFRQKIAMDLKVLEAIPIVFIQNLQTCNQTY